MLDCANTSARWRKRALCIMRSRCPAQKLDVRALCLIREALAYSSALADLAFVMQGLGTYAISQAAPEHVRDFWVSRAAEGKAIAAFALTEPDAGSDVAAIKTTATRDGDAYVIDGRKRFISNAGVADFYTVFARTGDRRKWPRCVVGVCRWRARCPASASSNARR